MLYRFTLIFLFHTIKEAYCDDEIKITTPKIITTPMTEALRVIFKTITDKLYELDVIDASKEDSND